MNGKQTIELLAPARDYETGIKALNAGADAIYIGAQSHGARAAAGNTTQEIELLCEKAHEYGARVYVTVNTLVKDQEIGVVEKLACDLYHAGADALIIQDMGILRMNLPPIDLHASTQCDIRDAEKAEFLVKSGLKRVVLARELGIGEIRAISQKIKPLGGEIEAFCHGALCVSFSGACRASQVLTGRSGNRGECSQICRLSYDLVNESSQVMVKDKHLLSLRDMQRIGQLGEMIDAGVTSFKIEGRLKDSTYVVNAVAAYRQALDREMAVRAMVKSSFGSGTPKFSPNLEKIFNRGYTSYFFEGPESKKMGSLLTPKSIGQEIGSVKNITHNQVDLFVKGGVEIANGDGMTFFDADNKLQGFRVNKADGSTIMLKEMVSGLKPGLKIYRNYDKAFSETVEDAMDKVTRKIDVRMGLRLAGKALCLDLEDERGNRVTVTKQLEERAKAVNDQKRARHRLLDKVGGTIYRVVEISDMADDVFIPASLITTLRREGLAMLERAWRMRRPIIYRTQEDIDVTAAKAENVANRLARLFYVQHQTGEIEDAIEIANDETKSYNLPLMTCRYCLRRELGQCLKHGGKKENWFLQARGFRLKLEFDCAKCQMIVKKDNKAI